MGDRPNSCGPAWGPWPTERLLPSPTRASKRWPLLRMRIPSSAAALQRSLTIGAAASSLASNGSIARRDELGHAGNPSSEPQRVTVPRVSVVVPTFRRATCLRELIGALEAQTLPPEDFDVFIVDDASPDETADVLADLAATTLVNLQVLRNER